MSRSKLLALAARVEAAPGADRELDAEIAVAVDGGEIVWKTASPTMEAYPARRYRSTAHIGGHGNAPVPAYTASLDAALTLVPAGYYWQAASGKQRHYEPQGSAELFVAHGANRGDMAFTADAATPALALTAAALRARAEEISDE